MKDTLVKYKKEIDTFCKSNRIAKLSLFGSYKKNTYNTKSDLDLLVEFEKRKKVGLLDITRMERELSEILKLKVDLRTPKELSRYFSNTFINETEVKYESRKEYL